MGEDTVTACEHVPKRAAPAPKRKDACEDCLREGSRWVNLNICQSCGRVGCCDSSPRKHARAHWKQGGHAVIQRVGAGWLWCFTHDRQVG